MSILTEAKRIEVGNKINELVSQITSHKVALTGLENKLADLRKTVSEDAVFTPEDLIEVDALPDMVAITAKEIAVEPLEVIK